MNIARWTTIAGVLGLLVPACTGDDSNPATSSPSSSSAAPPALATYDPHGVALQALHYGTLRFEVRGGTLCSFLDSTPVEWPLGFSSDRHALRNPTGATVAAAGEGLSIGGGLDGRPPDDTCSAPGEQVWLASGDIVERHNP